jgi:DNA-binding NarL/FixJ family response regulator
MSNLNKHIRILIVDDHAVVRRGLRHLLASHTDLEVVGEAGDGPSALQAATRLTPDVVLLDIRLPGASGLDVAPQLRQAAPAVRIIVLTTYEDDEYLVRAMGSGVQGYLLKSTSDEHVATAIRTVMKGERLVTPSLVNKALGQLARLSQTQARVDVGLTEEELPILRLLAGGATNKEIAQHLFVSERTVKRRVQDILKKLSVSHRAQAVIEATKRGII